MKANILYAGMFILAVIIIFAAVFSNHEVSDIRSAALEESPAETRQPEMPIPDRGPAVFNRQVITVIKPAQKTDSAAAAALEKIGEPRNLQSLDYPYGQNSSRFISKDIDEDAGVTAAGISRLGKYPTAEEVKEMNSKGIVLY
ncbi:MAG: hypothetical protein JXL82_01115 [Candidatus Omnitrophica bacterium]|nr:hypothetical protein [Candidatus Omnitrophota bacterium]